MFCSRKCAYQMRERVVSRPYVLVAQVDWSAASHKAWETRRRNAKPYPDAAREKARARAIERLQHGYAVSKFEMEVAEVLRRLGVAILTGAAVRNEDGTFAGVFDIVIPSRRILIECHGTYWHGGRWSWDDADATQRKNLMHEERKAIIARALGFDLRVLWEHEFKRDHIGACLSAIR